MTDPINDPSPSSQPSAYSQPNAYSQSGVPATGKKTLSLVSMISGIVALLLAWTGWGGVLLGLVAIVLGHLGQRREKVAGKGFWITGLITGYLALVIGIIIFILAAVFVAAYNNGDLGTVPTN